MEADVATPETTQDTDKLYQVWSALKKKNPTLPEYDQFKTDMENDEKKFRTVHAILKEKNRELPEFDQFTVDMFGSDPFKKKVPTEPSKNGGTVGASATPSSTNGSIMADGSIPQPIENMPGYEPSPTEGTPLNFEWSGGKPAQTVKTQATAALPQMTAKEVAGVPAHLKKMEAIQNAFKEKVRKQNEGKDAAIDATVSYPGQLVMGFVQGVTPMLSEASRSVAIMANQLDDAENNFFNDGNDKKVTDYATYKFAEAIDQFANDLPINSQLRQNLVGQLATGAGNLAGFAGAGVAGRAMKGISVFGKFTPEIVTGLSGAMQQGGTEFKAAYERITDAKQLTDAQYVEKYAQQQTDITSLIAEKAQLATHDAENDAFGVYLVNAAIGTSDALPISKWLGRLEKATGGLISKNVKKIALNGAVEGAIEEGVQESFQQLGTNLTAQQTYDKTREIMDGVLESGTIGGILGGTLNGLTLMVQSSAANNKTEEDQKYTDASNGYLQKLNDMLKNVAEDDIVAGNMNDKEVVDLEKQKAAVEQDMTNPDVDAETQNGLFEQAQEMEKQIAEAKAAAIQSDVDKYAGEYNEGIAEGLEEMAKNKDISPATKKSLLERAKDVRSKIKPLTDEEVNAAAESLKVDESKGESSKSVTQEKAATPEAEVPVTSEATEPVSEVAPSDEKSIPDLYNDYTEHQAKKTPELISEKYPMENWKAWLKKDDELSTDLANSVSKEIGVDMNIVKNVLSGKPTDINSVEAKKAYAKLVGKYDGRKELNESQNIELRKAISSEIDKLSAKPEAVTEGTTSNTSQNEKGNSEQAQGRQEGLLKPDESPVTEPVSSKGEPASTIKVPKKQISFGKNAKTADYVGDNQFGEPIYEDANGIRHKSLGRIVSSEPVVIVPGKTGVDYYASKREDDFKTKEELKAEKQSKQEPPPSEPKSEKSEPKSEKKSEKSEKKNVFDDPEIEDLMRKLREKRKGKIGFGVDPDELAIAFQIMSKVIAKGVRKLGDMAREFYHQFGEADLREYWDAITDAYSIAYNRAEDAVADQMDSRADMRKYNLDNLIETFKTEDDGKSESESVNGGSTTTVEPQVEPTPAGVAKGQSPGDVLEDEEKQGTGQVDSGKSAGSTGSTRSASVKEPKPRPSGGDGTGGLDVPISGNEKLNEELGGESKKQELPEPVEQTPVVSQTRHNLNFVIPPDFESPKNFSVSQKLDDNINALKTLITLAKEDRRATPEEQNTLFKYVGWGGIKEIGFDPNANGGWSASNKSLKPRIQQVLDLLKELDPENFKSNLDAIKRSTQNAHYTAIPVIRGMYNVIRQSGFTGGTTLEPSAGIGNFIGAMPIDMISKSNIAAIELDNITAKVLKNLYPNFIVKNTGYEKQPVAPGSVDLVISNIPFGNVSVYDPNFEKSKNRALKASQKQIHSYFFARALEDVKPNGLVAFVTSTGVMDSPVNADLRKHIGVTAELMGAIRLPNTTFKGNANTQVVTDIIFLRKFKEGENKAQRNRFATIEKSTVSHKDKKNLSFDISYNVYFHDHPEMVLGKFEAGGLYAQDEMTVTSTGIDLEKAISDLAPKIFPEKLEQTNPVADANEVAAYYAENKGERTGNVVEVSPGVYGIVSNEQAVGQEEGKHAVNKITIPKKYTQAVKDMINLRNALNDVYAAEYGDMGEDFITGKKADLKAAYDTFVKNNGTLYENRNLFNLDADGYKMLTLEKVEDKKVVGLADIFTKRVFEKAKKAESAANISDAVAINLSETGGVDLDRLAELLKITPEEVIKQGEGLIFKNPKGGFEEKSAYLSGNVRQKLEEAKIAAQEDPFYSANVKELESVQPAELNASQIYAPISAPWISTRHMNDFASEIFQQDVSIHRLSTGRVNVTGTKNTQVSEVYGTSRMNGLELLEEVMQNRMPLVKDSWKEDGKTITVVNEKATQEAIEKADKIKAAFDKWIWRDEKRRNELVNHYNENFNNTVLRKYDGSHLTFPGYAYPFPLRQHQKDGVWMVTQQMNGILDHIVGSGKSLLMATAAMKMKQMGLVKKPIIIGLKANAKDLAKTYEDAYPMAKVLYPEAKDFTPAKRSEFFAKMANNDWDAIIMTHDQFGMIEQSQEIQQEIIGQEIEALEEDIRAAKDNDLSKRDLNGLEVRKQNLESKLAALSSMAKDASLKSFDEMGIDFMFVDESQQFKNLTYNTIQRGVAGLGSPKGSTKAFNLLFAIRTLQKRYGADKGTVFASGTPISNTMVEMYLLFKYLRPNKMREMGINSFDNWANTFAHIGSEIEFGVTNSLKPKTRMREFMNVPEMSAMYREIADVRNDSNLSIPKPKFKQTVRIKAEKDVAKNEVVSIDGNKYKVIGKIKGLEKNEFWLSLMTLGKDAVPPKTGKVDYEGGQFNYSDSEATDGLLVNITPTKEQKKFAKKIQEFAKTKDGYHIGRPNLTDKEKKAYMLLATNLASKMAIDMRLVDPSYADTETGKLGVAADTIFEHWKESAAHKGIQLVFSDLGTPKSTNQSINMFDLLESRGVDKDTLETIFGPAAFSENPKYPSIKDVKERMMKSLEYSEQDFYDALSEASEGTFNIYQALKDKLVRRGIPAEEIAFIHDYNTDTKKSQLFTDARSGKVRVILGSTAKLGTGVNVQNKIIAMHHLDVPWRPSDMEQRNGRGIRQGNFLIESKYHNQLPVYYYATEQTLDAYKYQLLDTKQQFIDQAKTTDSSVRSISEGEGDEENGVSFAAMTAMLSGNPVILEKAKIDKKVKELESSAKSFDQEKYSLQDKISRDKKNLEDTANTIAEYKKDQTLFESNSTRNEKTGEWEYKAEIGGKDFAERKLAGEAIVDEKEKFKEEYYKRNPDTKNGFKRSPNDLNRDIVIGHIAGFEIHLKDDYILDEGKYYLAPKVYLKSPVSKSRFVEHASNDPVSIGSVIQRDIRDLGTDEIDRAERSRKAYEKSVADKTKYLESLPETFPREKEYKAALAQQEKIETRLKEIAASSAKDLPTSEVLESAGERLRNINEVMDLVIAEDEDIFAVDPDNEVSKVTSLDDIDQLPEGTRYYKYDDANPVQSIDQQIADTKKEIDDLEGDGEGPITAMNPIPTRRQAKLAAAYAKLAYLYLKKGITKLSDFIKAIGDKAHDFIVKAWNEAKEKFDKERISNALAKMKIGKGNTFSIMPPFNLFPAVWNTSIDLIRNNILGSATRTKAEINKAIEDGLAHAKTELVAAGGPTMTPAEEKAYRNQMKAVFLRLGPTPSFGEPHNPQTADEIKLSTEKVRQAINPDIKKVGALTKVADFFKNLSYHLDNPNRYVTKMEQDIYKQYPNLDRIYNVPLGRVMEQSSMGPAKLAVESFRKDVLKGMNSKQLENFNEYLFAKRVIDRLESDAQSRNTGNITLQDAINTLYAMEQRMSPNEYADLVDRGERFQEHMDQVLLTLVDADIISQETYDNIKENNEFYAPFNVVQHLFTDATKEAGKNAGATSVLFKIKGIAASKADLTLTDLQKLQDGVANSIITPEEFYRGALEILDAMQTSGKIDEVQYTNELSKLANPGFNVTNLIDKAAEIIYRSHVIAERNKFLKHVASFEQIDPDGHFFKKVDGFEARFDATGNAYMVPKDIDKIKAPEGFGVFKYKDDGKVKFLAVEEQAAKALRGMDRYQLNAAMKVMNVANSIARFGIITTSPSFMYANSIIDNYRTITMSKYGPTAGKDMVDTLLNTLLLVPQMTEALFSGLAANFTGYRTPQYLEWMKSKSFSRGIFDDPFQNPQRKITADVDKTLAQKVWHVIRYALTIPQRLGTALEQMPKLYTFERGMDVEGVNRIGLSKFIKENVLRMNALAGKTGVDLANALDTINYEVLNYAGSPHFGASANWAKMMSSFFQFFSARVKGEMSDWRRITNTEGTNKPQYARFLFKLGMYVLLPQLFLALRNMWDDDDEKKYESVRDYDKNNNMMYPTGVTFEFDGEQYQDYFKIPQRGVPATANTLVNSMVLYYKHQNPEMFKNIVKQAYSNATPLNLQGDNVSEVAESAISNTNPMFKFGYEQMANRNAFYHTDLIYENNPKYKRYMKGDPDIKPYEIINDRFGKTPPWAINASKTLYDDLGIAITPVSLDHFENAMLGNIMSIPDSNSMTKRILRSREDFPIKK